MCLITRPQTAVRYLIVSRLLVAGENLSVPPHAVVSHAHVCTASTFRYMCRGSASADGERQVSGCRVRVASCLGRIMGIVRRFHAHRT